MIFVGNIRIHYSNIFEYNKLSNLYEECQEKIVSSNNEIVKLKVRSEERRVGTE